MLHAGYGLVRFMSSLQPGCGTCTEHLMPARDRISSVVNSVGLQQCVYSVLDVIWKTVLPAQGRHLVLRANQPGGARRDCTRQSFPSAVSVVWGSCPAFLLRQKLAVCL